jgi:hypothetical protein
MKGHHVITTLLVLLVRPKFRPVAADDGFATTFAAICRDIDLDLYVDSRGRAQQSQHHAASAVAATNVSVDQIVAMVGDTSASAASAQHRSVPAAKTEACLKMPLAAFNDTYMLSLINISHGITVVSPNRRIATAKFVMLALTLTPPDADLVETGVYLGGSTALQLKMLQDFDACGRHFYAFDSFEGLPSTNKMDSEGTQNVGSKGSWAASQQVFEQNLKDRGVFNETVLTVTKGWFKDTLPTSPVRHIAFLRMDGDVFESTWSTITSLYDRVVPGGIIYVDDYGSFNGCKQAINLFRNVRRITEPLHFVHEKFPQFKEAIYFEAVFWQKLQHH